MDAELNARLDALDRKLDSIVERQRFTQEFIREMTPVGRVAMNAMAARLAAWEDRGWFAIAAELGNVLDALGEAYGPDDVHELSTSIVQIFDTVRNLTQPDLLDLANDATNVLHEADQVSPVGPMGAMAASRDEDVQRGLGIALEILRHLGRSHGTGRVSQPRRRATSTPETPARETPSPACPPSEVVVWEGHRFTADGFLLDTAAWDEALAAKMAEGLGLELTEDHWKVLRFAREDYLRSGASPNVRRMASGSGVGVRRMYELFPKTPGKAAAMVAGIPKPAGCV